MSVSRGIIVAVASFAVWSGVLPLVARAEPVISGPLERVSLVELGYGDTTLRGRSVVIDYSFPGPGDYLVGNENFLDFDYLPSPVLSRGSNLQILWNGVPFEDVPISGAPGRTRVSLRIPKGAIDPDSNRLQVQAFLGLSAPGCGAETDDSARHITVFDTSQVRYSYDDRTAYPRPPAIDLARYPAPFFLRSHPQPAPVRFIVPKRPTSAELGALVRVAAQLGQFAGARGIRLEVSREGDALDPAVLAQRQIVFVGRERSLPTLQQLPESAIRRAPGGGYLDERGERVPPTTGVVLEVPSPWNPGRLALAVTGEEDQAVERAATAVASRAGLRALRGSYALVGEAFPVDAPALGAGSAITLADLGRGDDLVSGVGDKTLFFLIEAAGSSTSGSLPFDLVLSHSPLLDEPRSSVRVVLNGVPVGSVTFRGLAPQRAVARVNIPAQQLRPGPNLINLEFSLQLPPFEQGAGCASLPVEQAWAVLHKESRIQPPTGDAPREITLGSYPFPFIARGRLSDTLIVCPDDLGDANALVKLAADLGRQSRADVMELDAVTVSDFDPASDRAAKNVILLGQPSQNRVLAGLQDRLPIQLDGDQRFVFGRDITLAVRDLSNLGVVQLIQSPWVSGRWLLAVTSTSDRGADLAVEAVRQGGLSGNAALASLAEAPRPAPGRTPAPERLAVGGPLPERLEVTTYTLRAAAAAAPAAQAPFPYALVAALVVGVLALLLAFVLVYQAYVADRRGRRAGSP